jgi:hypothetical protein
VFGKRRRRADDGDGSDSALGIGALVRVVPDPRPDGRGETWADEPIGLIVGPGTASVTGYSPGTGTTWTVEFDEPAYTKDGRGPFERATVPGRQLVPLPVE